MGTTFFKENPRRLWNYSYHGELSVPGGLLDVCDPCSDREPSPYSKMSVPVVPGLYECVSTHRDLMDWGVRIVSCAVFLESEQREFMLDRHPEEFCCVGVDSGLAGFFISPKKEYPHTEEGQKIWEKFCDEFYGRPSPQALVKDGYFVTGTGYGDGTYYGYATRNKEGRIIGIELVFIDDTEVDPDDEEE